MARVKARKLKRIPIVSKIKKSPRRRIPRTRMSAPRTDPFVHCVLGPVDAIGNGSGAPTGGTEPTVVIDHRQLVTVTPVNGEIAVALIGSANGALAIGKGKAQVSKNYYVYNTTIGGWDIGSANATTVAHDFKLIDGDGVDNYGVIPFKENVMMGTYVGETDRTNSGLRFTKFRTLTTTASANFTGSTMYDNGQAATGRISHAFDEEATNLVYLATKAVRNNVNGARLGQQPPMSMNDVVGLPGSRTFPVRECVQMTNVPSCFEFQPIRSSWAPFTISTSAGVGKPYCRWFGEAVDTSSGEDPKNYTSACSMGVGYGPVTYYYASGMDSNASVTFDVRCCIEYTLAFSSPAARLASLPPRENPAAVATVKEVGRTLPSSAPLTPLQDEHGWLGNAFKWYGNTMKGIVGTAWQVGGGLLSMMPGGGTPGSAIGNAGRQLALTY